MVVEPVIHRPRLLIADDNLQFIELLSEFLKDLDIEVWGSAAARSPTVPPASSPEIA